MAQANWKFLLKIGRRELIRYQKIIDYIESITPGDRSSVIKEILLAHIEESEKPAKRRTRQKPPVIPTPAVTLTPKTVANPVSNELDIDDLPKPDPIEEPSDKRKQSTNKKEKVLKTILMGEINDEDLQIIQKLKNIE